MTEAECDQADRLASGIVELLKNWGENNNVHDVDLVMAALGLVAVGAIDSMECPHCRQVATTSLLDTILHHARVDRESVLDTVRLLGGREKGRKLDA